MMEHPAKKNIQHQVVGHVMVFDWSQENIKANWSAGHHAPPTWLSLDPPSRHFHN
jgi:hypothetical protein